MREFTEKLHQPVPRAELQDFKATWPGYWKEYTIKVRVPLFYGLAEFDDLLELFFGGHGRVQGSLPAQPEGSLRGDPQGPTLYRVELPESGLVSEVFRVRD